MSCPDRDAGGEAGSFETSTDAFHGGAFHLLQPKGQGFRAGLDALLVAACVPENAGGRAADLGSGSGAVGFAAARRAPGLTLTLVERDAAMANLAEASRRLPVNAPLAGRLAVLRADILAARPAREAAGLPDASFDLVLTNPPFHPAGSRASPDPGRRAARQIPEDGFLPRWLRVAASLLRHGGRFAMIGRPENLADILAGASNRLGALTLLPVHTRPDRPATRILVGGVRGSRAAGPRILPAALLFDAAGREIETSRDVAAGRHTFPLFDA